MPHGTPDWAQYAAKKTVYGEIDTSELAARLGSIVTFDRRGDVIWLDDFEGGLGAWRLGAVIAADLPTWSSVYKKSGSFSAKLSTSAVIDYRSDLTHYMPLPVISRVGLEFSFSLTTTKTTIQCSLYFWDGTHRAEYGVRYNQEDETLEYWGTDSEWHAFATGVKPYPRVYMFNTLKLVVDLEAVEFVRVILNGDTYSMAGLIPWNEAFVFNSFLQVQIRLRNLVAEAKVSYIDDVIITQNEP